MVEQCPSCGSKETKQLKCLAGDLTICKACGQSWNYNKNFKITPFKIVKKSDNEKLIL